MLISQSMPRKWCRVKKHRSGDHRSPSGPDQVREGKPFALAGRWNQETANHNAVTRTITIAAPVINSSTSLNISGPINSALRISTPNIIGLRTDSLDTLSIVTGWQSDILLVALPLRSENDSR